MCGGDYLSMQVKYALRVPLWLFTNHLYDDDHAIEDRNPDSPFQSACAFQDHTHHHSSQQDGGGQCASAACMDRSVQYKFSVCAFKAFCQGDSSDHGTRFCAALLYHHPMVHTSHSAVDGQACASWAVMNNAVGHMDRPGPFLKCYAMGPCGLKW